MIKRLLFISLVAPSPLLADPYQDLKEAISKKNFDLLRSALAQGADPNAALDKLTPLTWSIIIADVSSNASFAKTMNIIQLLTEHPRIEINKKGIFLMPRMQPVEYTPLGFAQQRYDSATESEKRRLQNLINLLKQRGAQ